MFTLLSLKQEILDSSVAMMNFKVMKRVSDYPDNPNCKFNNQFFINSMEVLPAAFVYQVVYVNISFIFNML